MEYFLRKLTEAMGTVWSKESFAEYKQRQNSKNFLTAWELIELVGMGYFSKGLNRQILSMGINEVFNELILDVLKEVREDVDLLYCVFLIFAASDFPSKISLNRELSWFCCH